MTQRLAELRLLPDADVKPVRQGETLYAIALELDRSAYQAGEEGPYFSIVVDVLREIEPGWFEVKIRELVPGAPGSAAIRDGSPLTVLAGKTPIAEAAFTSAHS